MSATRTLGVFLKRASQKTTAPRFLGTASEPLVKTALFDLHKELGGDMVPFAGYELPVLYKGENGGVMKEHLWCRSDGKASLFDVSHMGQVRSSDVLARIQTIRYSTSHNTNVARLMLRIRFVGTEKTAPSFWKRLSWATLRGWLLDKAV